MSPQDNDRPTLIMHAMVKARAFLLGAQPYFGTVAEMADETGIPADRLRGAISRTRTPEHIAEYSWTIPFVGRGPRRNAYWLVDADENANNAAMTVSVYVSVRERLNGVRRSIAGTRLALVPLDPQSREYARQVDQLVDLRGHEQVLEKLVASFEAQFSDDDG